MQTIKILFTTSKKRFSPVSYLIREFLNADYSHVAIQIDDVVSESMMEGFRNIKITEFIKTQKIIEVYSVQLTEGQHVGLVHTLKTFKDIPYSVKNLLGNAISITFKDGRPIKAFRDGISKMMCSEMVYRAIIKEFEKFPDADFVTPKDIRNVCKEIGSLSFLRG